MGEGSRCYKVPSAPAVHPGGAVSRVVVTGIKITTVDAQVWSVRPIELWTAVQRGRAGG